MRIAGTMRAPLILGALLLAMAGCKMPGSDASAKVAVFHQRLDAGDFETIWNETGPDIRTTASKDEFIKLLATVHGRLGKVRTSKQTGWNVRTDTTGSTAEVTMQTTFERGDGVETFVYKGSGEAQKLAGYHITPNAK